MLDKMYYILHPETFVSDLQKDGLKLRYVDNQSDDLCKIAVQFNGFCIQYVKNKTEEYISNY